MPKNNSLGLIFVAITASVALSVWWLSGRNAGAPAAPASGGEAAKPAAAAPADASGAQVPAAAEHAPQRVAVAPDAAAGAGPALVGTVQDAAGAAVAGARVACTPDSSVWNELAALDTADDFAFDQANMLARIRADQEQRVESTTDASGHFRLVPPGRASTVHLSVRARGCVVLESDAQRPAGADRDLGVLTLQRGAIVAGQVLDRKGQPVAGARVLQRPQAEAQMLGGVDFEVADGVVLDEARNGADGLTDAEGRFELAHVEPGSVSLRARHPDHPTARLELQLSAGKSVTDARIVLEPGTEIRGRVVGVPDGVQGLRVFAAVRPLEGAQPAAGVFSVFGGDPADFLADAGMVMGEKAAEVGADGAFALRGLSVGRTYRIQAVQSAPGAPSGAVCSTRLEIAAGLVNVELRYDVGSTVTCRVLDARDGTPIEHLWVQDRLHGGDGFEDMMTAFGPHAGACRDYPGGRVVIQGLRPKKKQKLSLTIEALGHASFRRDDLVLPAQGTLDLGDVRLERAPVVHVTVIAADTGKPVSGARVALRNANEPAAAAPFAALANGASASTAQKTNADGRCELNSLPGGKGTLEVTEKDHSPYVGEVDLPARDDCTQEVRLLRGGTVEVEVVDGDKPVNDIAVEHASPQVLNDRRKTDAGGHALFEHLAPGQHRFRLGERGDNPFAAAMAFARSTAGEADADAVGWQSCDVAEGGTTTLRITRKPASTLHGVVRENGVLLEGAKVTFVEGTAADGDDNMQQQLIASMAAAKGGVGSARTGDDGRYELRDLPAGEHRLRVLHSERSMPTVVAVSLRAGDNALDLDLDLTVLRGTVVDPQGQPVAGAAVTVRKARKSDDAGEGAAAEMMGNVMPGLFGGGSSVRSGDDGSYELRGVAAGVPLQVRATAKGFAAVASAPVEVARGATKDVGRLQLGAAGRIRVTSANASGITAAHATYVGADGKGDPEVAPAFVILRKGEGMLDGLRPGRWKVELGGAGEAPEAQVVDVVAGQTATAGF